MSPLDAVSTGPVWAQALWMAFFFITTWCIVFTISFKLQLRRNRRRRMQLEARARRTDPLEESIRRHPSARKRPTAAERREHLRLLRGEENP